MGRREELGTTRVLHLLQLGRLERVDAIVAGKEADYERNCQGNGRR